MMYRTKTLYFSTMVAAGLTAACGAGAQSQDVANAQTAQQGIGFPAGSRFVDLTQTLEDNIPYWPTAPSGFSLTRAFHGQTPGGFFFSVNMIGAMTEHTGTHLDAPVHFAENGTTSEGIALDRLIAPAVVIDISKAAAGNADAQLAVSDIEAFEQAHGAIAAGTIVLVRTDWAKRWPDRKAYFGDDKLGDASNMHFPGISGDAAKVLVERRVAAVGIDSPSIDYGQSQDFIVHQTLLKAEIVAFENLASLAELPARGAMVIALPMKIGGGSGAPLRAVAVVPPN